MRSLLVVLLFSFSVGTALSQTTCTITGTSPVLWTNPGPNCLEGGNASAYSVLVIPASMVVTVGGADTWTGTRIEVNGTLNVTADATFNTSILVKSGGLIALQAKLSLGTAAGCGLSLTVNTGGRVHAGVTGSDRLSVCGEELMKGNGVCNSCGGTNSGTCPYNGQAYCQPTGGFTGPTGFDEDGYNSSLPIKLSYFEASENQGLVVLNWATVSEKNFRSFIIQRSGGGLDFDDIGEVDGQGYDINSLETKYSFTDKGPLLGYNYYRLKAVDIDGKYEFFTIKSVKIEGRKGLNAYPNPGTGESITFTTNFNPSEGDRVKLLNTFGEEILNLNVVRNDNVIRPAQSLSPGTYFVQYIGAAFTETIRVIIKE